MYANHSEYESRKDVAAAHRLAVLHGLNEGVWPEQPRPDPWLNRKMRSDVGLQSLERQIGLSAHDFQQAIAARSVVLSRATRDDEAATVPSRWLNRLLNLVGGLPDQGGKEAIRRCSFFNSFLS